jgi:hypothetical protein
MMRGAVTKCKNTATLDARVQTGRSRVPTAPDGLGTR